MWIAKSWLSNFQSICPNEPTGSSYTDTLLSATRQRIDNHSCYMHKDEPQCSSVNLHCCFIMNDLTQTIFALIKECKRLLSTFLVVFPPQHGEQCCGPLGLFPRCSASSNGSTPFLAEISWMASNLVESLNPFASRFDARN